MRKRDALVSCSYACRHVKPLNPRYIVQQKRTARRLRLLPNVTLRVRRLAKRLKHCFPVLHHLGHHCASHRVQCQSRCRAMLAWLKGQNARACNVPSIPWFMWSILDEILTRNLFSFSVDVFICIKVSSSRLRDIRYCISAIVTVQTPARASERPPVRWPNSLCPDGPAEVPAKIRKSEKFFRLCREPGSGLRVVAHSCQRAP